MAKSAHEKSQSINSKVSAAKAVQQSRRINSLEIENSQLRSEIHRLHTEIHRQAGLKKQLVSLYTEVDKRIINYIETKGMTPAKKAKILESYSGEDMAKVTSLGKLLYAAHELDVNTYFSYRVPRNTAKPFYKVLGRVYITSRNTTKCMVRGAQKTLKGLKK